MQLLTSVVTSKFSCPTFRVFPGKRHESSTSQPAPLLASSSWELIPPFCGEKNLLLTFLADFPSYSPFFEKKQLPFCPLSCGLKKVLQNSNLIHPFLTQGTPTDSSKISVSARSPHAGRRRIFAFFDPKSVHREAEIVYPQREFFWGVLYARYLENSSMNGMNKKKTWNQGYIPPKAEGHSQFTGPFSVYICFWSSAPAPIQKFLAANEWWGVHPD